MMVVYTPLSVTPHEHPFEAAISVMMEDIELILRGHLPAEWADFWLNPRRLRGSDFLMRWSQGVWSEDRLTEAVNTTDGYFALPYGPSGVAPDEVRQFELYFERLEAAGLGDIKRPDLLVFRKSDRQNVQERITALGGISELPFIPEERSDMEALLRMAVIAVEAENSLWASKKMPDYDRPLTPQKRLGGKLGLKASAVVPTVIIKDQDLSPLREWQALRGVPLHVWHVFYDQAFGISLDRADQLVSRGEIVASKQVFQAPSGATTTKLIYKIYYHHAYRLATAIREPELRAASITDKNGHILPYVAFSGGTLEMLPDAIRQLDQAAAARPDS